MLIFLKNLLKAGNSDSTLENYVNPSRHLSKGVSSVIYLIRTENHGQINEAN